MMLPHMQSPCAECPWRRDVPLGKFTPSRYQKLASTAYEMTSTIFACHMTPENKTKACAGFILQSSVHNLSIRMSRQNFDHVTSAYPLFATYREMAIANGVKKNDPVLRSCRDDGAR